MFRTVPRSSPEFHECDGRICNALLCEWAIDQKFVRWALCLTGSVPLPRMSRLRTITALYQPWSHVLGVQCVSPHMLTIPLPIAFLLWPSYIAHEYIVRDGGVYSSPWAFFRMSPINSSRRLWYREYTHIFSTIIKSCVRRNTYSVPLRYYSKPIWNRCCVVLVCYLRNHLAVYTNARVVCYGIESREIYSSRF